MIQQLTPDQEAQLATYRDKWLKIGLSTDPLDFERAKDAAIRAYREAEISPPTNFYRSRSPKECALQIQEVIPGMTLNDSLHAQIFGSHEAGWLAFHDFMSSVLNIKASERLRPLMDLAKSCGWWAPYSDTVFFQDRPKTINFDNENRAHSETGPAIEYRDGFSVYCWHGTRVPGAWINGDLDAKTALKWKNIEQRRAACEILGWNNIISELDARVVDEGADMFIGRLLEVDIPGSGKEKFLQVQCGTGRIFAFCVPKSMETALQANAWSFDVNPESFKVEVRT